MRTHQCNCGRRPGSAMRHQLKISLSEETCDVYGCPSYIKGLETGWSRHTTPQRPYTKFRNKSLFSKAPVTNYNLSVPQFFFKALAKSSINGISNCASTSTVFGKLIWLIVFILCVVGFAYQASHFYGLYKNKPSVVQIDVENDGEVEFPAVTVCTTNRFRKSKFCEYFPDNCTNPENLTISEFEINGVVYNLLLKKKEYLIKGLGHSRSIFESCRFIGTPIVEKEECLSLWEDFYDPDYGNCFTFPSRNKENVQLQVRKVDFWQEENELSLLMDAEPEEFMEMKRSPGLLLIVHDEKSFPDIHTEGIYLTAGFSYTVTVAKSTVLLLPLPYKTNCTDYWSLPWQGLYPKRLTSRMCTVGCSQYLQFQKCNYVTRNLSLFYKTLPYGEEHVTEENMKCAKEEELRTIDYCRSVCGLPCKNTHFAATVGTSRLSETEIGQDLDSRENESVASIYDDIIYVKVFYSTLEHTVYRHIPKYDTMELFSFLGGYSGVWLGFSLLTIYELCEIILSTILYCFRKQRYQRKHKRLVNSIVNSRKHTKTTVKTYKKKRNSRW